MAQYDGSIRINTKIDTKDAKVQLSALRYTIVKTADEMKSLRSKMDALKDAQIPTERYKELQKYIENTEAQMIRLTETMKQMEADGKAGSDVYKDYQKTIADMGTEIENARVKMQELVDTGKAFTIGKDTDEYRNLARQLGYEQKALAKYTANYIALGASEALEETKQAYKKMGAVLKGACSRIADFAKKSNKSVSEACSGVKKLLLSFLGFRQITKVFNAMTSAMKEGFSNLYKEVDLFRGAVDRLKASSQTLKNSFAAAFRPLVEVAIPYIQKAADALTGLMNSIGQFTAAITGQKTYTKAIKQTADAFGEAQKAAEGYLSPVDEINKYRTSQDIKVDSGTDGAMFEEAPIESRFIDMADRIKKVLTELFQPLKTAWESQGQFVMNSWKYALEEIGLLTKSVGENFLEVWKQPGTVSVLENILVIIGDIGLAVGNLARNFHLAWEENGTGKRILEGIRDIIGVITANIRHAADVTAEWAKKIDFSPFLTKLQGWIESLIPAFDFLSGVVTDFYERVLLPLGKWTMEKGLPELLQILADFNNKIDWESIRERLKEFWKHLEPFAETIGEGLIIFIGRLSETLAGFVNSPAFEKFLSMLEKWMDRVNPEDIADGLGMICKSILGFKALSGAFSVISAGAVAISKLASVLKFFGVGGSAAKAAAAMGETGAAAVGMGESVGAIPGIFGIAVNSLGTFGLGIETLKRVQKNASLDKIFEATTQAANLLKQGLDAGAISIEEYESQMKKLGDAANLAGLKNDSESIAQFNSVLDETSAMLAKAGESMDEFGRKSVEVGENISSGLMEGVENMDTAGAMRGIAQGMIDAMKNVFQVHSPSIVMKEIGMYIMQGLLNGIASLTGSVTDVFGSIKEKISQKWEEIKTNTSQKWNEIKQGLSEKWEGIKSGAKATFEKIGSNIKSAWDNAKQNTESAWNNMKSKVSTITADISEKVLRKFGDIKKNLNDFSSTAQSVWADTWSAMKEKANSMLDSIKSIIGSAFEWISEKVSGILDKLGSITSKASSVKGSVSSAFSTSRVSRMASPAFASLANVEIPRLATGTVIPANKEFLAVLGDQKSGTNIEAPLDTIKQANRESLIEVLSELGLTGGNRGPASSRPVELKLMVDRHELGRVMIEEGKLQQMSTGRNIFMLGLT